jgi:hypothetical protein
MAKSKKSKIRRAGASVKRRVKAAKPSVAIALGLGSPAAMVLVGGSNQFSSGIPKSTQELVNRVKIMYLGTMNNPGVQTAVTSTAAKLGVAGFVVHGIANITGANRYLARMKWPIRI